MKLACFDNNVLLWAIKEDATQGQEEMIHRAKGLVKHLGEEHVPVLVPSVVVAEFLMRIPEEVHTTILNLFDKVFIVAPFDGAAASMFSRIWRKKKDLAVIDQLAKG